MEIITDLTIQKRNKNKVNISLNNKFYCVMNLETVVKNNLKKGSVISQQRLQEMQGENEKAEAFNLALKLVSKRYKTKHEVKKYLQEKGYLDAVTFSVIDRLKEYHYLDDMRYAESYISHHPNKGRNFIKQALFNKGVSEDIITEVLASIPDQTETMQKLLEKYMKNKETSRENYAKAVRYLVGKGFSYEEVLKALKKEAEE